MLQSSSNIFYSALASPAVFYNSKTSSTHAAVCPVQNSFICSLKKFVSVLRNLLYMNKEKFQRLPLRIIFLPPLSPLILRPVIIA